MYLRVVLRQIYVERNRKEIFDVWQGNFTKKGEKRKMWVFERGSTGWHPEKFPLSTPPDVGNIVCSYISPQDCLKVEGGEIKTI